MGTANESSVTRDAPSNWLRVFQPAVVCAHELIVVVFVAIAPFPFLFHRRLSIGTQDYSLTNDTAEGKDTPVVYAWRLGEGIGIHTKDQRGSVMLDFANGTVTSICGNGSSEYYALHGALLLVAWLIVAPYGLYQAR